MELKDIPHTAESVATTGIAPGEHYVAQRNGPARVLTAHVVNDDSGYVVPVEHAYPYGMYECHQITKEVYDMHHQKCEADFAAWMKQYWKA